MNHHGGKIEKSGSEGQRELGNKVEKTKRKEERREGDEILPLIISIARQCV